MKKNFGSKSSTIQTSYSNYAVDSCGSKGEYCMKGSIFPQKDRDRWAVNWYCSIHKQSFVITRYRNHFMPITHIKR